MEDSKLKISSALLESRKKKTERKNKQNLKIYIYIQFFNK